MTDDTEKFEDESITRDLREEGMLASGLLLWSNPEIPEEIATDEMLSNLGKTMVLEELLVQAVGYVSELMETAELILTPDSAEVRLMVMGEHAIVGLMIDWSTGDYYTALQESDIEDAPNLSFERDYPLLFASDNWGLLSALEDDARMLFLTWGELKATLTAGMEKAAGNFAEQLIFAALLDATPDDEFPEDADEDPAADFEGGDDADMLLTSSPADDIADGTLVD